MQTPDHKTGAYYVTVRRSDGATILALGPFRRHVRALGLTDALRRHVVAAGMDPWLEYGYGTSRLPLRRDMPAGKLNAALHVGPEHITV
jgi:hypothetical protein